MSEVLAAVWAVLTSQLVTVLGAAAFVGLPLLRKGSQRAAVRLAQQHPRASWIKLAVRLGLLPEAPPVPVESLLDRIRSHAHTLRRASADLRESVDQMEGELALREASLARLEVELIALGDREQALQRRIDALRKVEPEALAAFAEMSAPAERRSANRDYTLFLLGAAVSFLVSLIFAVVGG